MTHLALRSITLLIIGALFAVSCGSGAGDQVDPTSTSTTPAHASTPQSEAPDTTQPAVEIVEPVTECEGPVEEFAFGTTIESVIPTADGATTIYYCVEVPTDVDGFTVELKGMSENLDLFMGFPDLATLTEGGFGLKYSTAEGTTDEWVTVEMKPNLLWKPGAYYVEVSAGSSNDSSPFTLSATEL